MKSNSKLTKVGLASGGLVAGVVLAGTMAAQASPSPSPAPGSGNAPTATTQDPHPGDNGADGVPEAQEHHGDHLGGRFGEHQGRGLGLSGTVKAVGTNSVSIQTSAGVSSYAVTSASDIDKYGESKLSDLAVGDAVTFSVDGTGGKTIDKLHAGDEARNAPPADAPSGSTTPPNA